MNYDDWTKGELWELIWDYEDYIEFLEDRLYGGYS